MDNALRSSTIAPWWYRIPQTVWVVRMMDLMQGEADTTRLVFPGAAVRLRFESSPVLVEVAAEADAGDAEVRGVCPRIGTTSSSRRNQW